MSNNTHDIQVIIWWTQFKFKSPTREYYFIAQDDDVCNIDIVYL
jgi:hypothetical protein